MKKKTLYWNIYKDKKRNDYVVGDSYSIKSLEESTERKDRFETEEYEFVKTISVEVEE